MRLILMSLLALFLAVGVANAKTWECDSGVHYGTGVTSGDYVRSCLGNADDVNSAAFDLADGDDDPSNDDDDEDK
jgi:hypothetical protein